MRIIIIVVLMIFSILGCLANQNKIFINKVDSLFINDNKNNTLIDSLIKLYPTNDYLVGLKIYKLAELNKLDDAEQILNKYNSDTNTFLETARGKYYFKRKDIIDGINSCNKAIALDSEKVNVWPLLELADYNIFVLKNKIEGCKYLNIVIDYEPSNSYAKVLLTENYINDNNYLLADSLLNTLPIHYYESHILKYKSFIAFHFKDYEKALLLIQESLKLDSNDKEAQIQEIDCLRKTNNSNLFLNKLNMLLIAYPKETLLHYYLSEYYFKNDKFEQAEKEAKISFSLNKSNYGAFLLLLKIYISQDKYKEALSDDENYLLLNQADYILDAYKILLKILIIKHIDSNKIFEEYNSKYKNAEQQDYLLNLIKIYQNKIIESQKDK